MRGCANIDRNYLTTSDLAEPTSGDACLSMIGYPAFCATAQLLSVAAPPFAAAGGDGVAATEGELAPAPPVGKLAGCSCCCYCCCCCCCCCCCLLLSNLRLITRTDKLTSLRSRLHILFRSYTVLLGVHVSYLSTKKHWHEAKELYTSSCQPLEITLRPARRA